MNSTRKIALVILVLLLASLSHRFYPGLRAMIDFDGRTPRPSRRAPPTEVASPKSKPVQRESDDLGTGRLAFGLSAIPEGLATRNRIHATPAPEETKPDYLKFFMSCHLRNYLAPPPFPGDGSRA